MKPTYIYAIMLRIAIGQAVAIYFDI